MTVSLEKAFAQASQLSEEIQDGLARQMLQDIRGELKWDKTLAQSQAVLEKMARKAVAARRNKKVTHRALINCEFRDWTRR